MNKKNLFVRMVIFILLLGMTLPSFYQRITNERKNKDVVFALNYNNAAMVLSDEEMGLTLKENKKIGVNTAIVAEESLNSLINGGYVSAIKYNVLCHKYDDESEEIIKNLSGNKKIHNDSYVLITKRDEWKAFLEKWITSKYTKDEYVKTTSPSNADVYVIYKTVSNAWEMAVGFDERKLEMARKNGMEIVLSMMLDTYQNIEYAEEIGEIINKYDIKFINLKENYKEKNDEKVAKKNYTAFCKLIEENELFLVLTEEATQLSNQKPIGYEKLIESADGRVLRGYETIDYDTTNLGATKIDKRYHQILNSVVDRNIRFVSVNQLTNGTDSVGEKSKKTDASTKAVIEKLNEIGYITESCDTQFNYKVNRTLTSAEAMLIMILMCLTMLEWLAGKRLMKIEVLALIGGVLSVGFTYIAPEAIVLLYPTLFAVIAPCFCISAVLMFVKHTREKLSPVMFIASSAILSLLLLLLCATVQAALLSGLDYYLNSLVLRGVKLSLIAPVIFSAIAFGILFMDKTENLSAKIVKILNAQIKVYWVIIAGVIGAVAVIYLVRSGNVQSISAMETLMRNTITELMAARPRTKEFLVGWPCLALMLYYLKNTKCTLVQWCFAVGSSILFASVINSFCHVFTSAEVIYSRVFNGLVIGILVSAAALIANHIIVMIVKKYLKAGKANG